MYKYIFAVAFRGRFRKRWNERLSRASSSTPVRVEVAVEQNVVARISQVSVFLAAAGLGGWRAFSGVQEMLSTPIRLLSGASRP